jgi:sulfur carrier protein ThiS
MCYEIAMKVELDGTVREVEKRLTVRALLDTLSLSKESHLVLANGTLVTEDQMLSRDDQIRIIRVISGG